jgi:hypothetical protein
VRRPTDKIVAWAATVLVAVLLIGAPLLSGAIVGWAARAGDAGQPTERPRRQVPVVPLWAAPAFAAPSGPGRPLNWYAAGTGGD